MIRCGIVGMGLLALLLFQSAAAGQPAQQEVIYKGIKLKEWTAALKSPDRSARLAAAEAFVALGDKAKAAAPELIKAFDDEDGMVRYQAVQALAKMGEDVVPMLETATKADKAATRFYAKAALIKMGASKNTTAFEGKLTKEDRFDRGRNNCYHKVQIFKMIAGQSYVIDLESKVFDSYLRLEDASNKELAQDDDGGGFPHARILFTPKVTEEYRIIITTYAAGKTGPYTLRVQVLSE